jgi:hypothetical protein
MNRSPWLVLTLFALTVQFAGCFQQTVRDPESLMCVNDKKILVTTKDGWRYWFSGGEYSVVIDSTGTKVLTGKARRYRGENTQGDSFEGSLPFARIEKVTVSETTPLVYFSLGMLSGITVLTVWILISLHGLRFG